MLTPLVNVTLPSIYNKANLPSRMARAAPDFAKALAALSEEMPKLLWSDLFRSYEMQKAANDDYVSGRKSAYSPPPGGSMHEAGRAMDIDLGTIGMTLDKFWVVCKDHGLNPIISAPNKSAKEAWHFDCRGSHGLVYEYVQSGKVNETYSPYGQMARSGILSIGQHVDGVPDLDVALIQSALIRLGGDPGPIDGLVGTRTKKALTALGVTLTNADEKLTEQLAEKFPDEYS